MKRCILTLVLFVTTQSIYAAAASGTSAGASAGAAVAIEIQALPKLCTIVLRDPDSLATDPGLQAKSSVPLVLPESTSIAELEKVYAHILTVNQYQ